VAVRQNASSRGWDLARLEKKNKLYLMDARLDPESVISGEFSIKGLLAILDQRIKAMRAKLILIDAADALLHFVRQPHARAPGIICAARMAAGPGIDRHHDGQDRPAGGGSFPVRIYGLHGGLRDSRGPARHGSDHHAPLRVIKYRGSGYGRNEYPFIIDENGSNIIPITATFTAPPSRSESVERPGLVG